MNQKILESLKNFNENVEWDLSSLTDLFAQTLNNLQDILYSRNFRYEFYRAIASKNLIIDGIVLKELMKDFEICDNEHFLNKVIFKFNKQFINYLNF